MTPLELLAGLDRVGFAAVRLLLAVLWQSSLLFVAVAGLSWLVRKRWASVRCALWIAALLIAPTLPLLTQLASKAGAPYARIAVLPPRAVAPHLQELTEAHSGPPASTADAGAGPSASVLAPVAASTVKRPLPPLSDHPWALLLTAYVVGLAAFLGWIIVGRLRIHTWIRGANAVEEERVLSAFRGAAECLHLRRPVKVVASDRVPAPFTVGAFRPVVLLPRDLAPLLTDSELDAVAVHESAHVAQRDPLILSLAMLVRAGLFFHPLVWLACRYVSLLSEQAADDAVIEILGEPAPYAKLLARIAEGLSRWMLSTELAAGIVLSKSAFLKRVEAILADRRQFRKLTGVAVLVIILGVILSIGIAVAAPLGEKAGPQADASGIPLVDNSPASLQILRLAEDLRMAEMKQMQEVGAAAAKHWEQMDDQAKATFIRRMGSQAGLKLPTPTADEAKKVVEETRKNPAKWRAHSRDSRLLTNEERRHFDHSRYYALATEASKLGDKAVPELARIAGRTGVVEEIDRRLTVWAFESLREIATEASQKALLELTKSDDPFVLGASLSTANWALDAADDVRLEVMSRIIELAKATDPDLRRAASQAIIAFVSDRRRHESEPPDWLPVLIELAADKDDLVRRGAAEAMGSLADRRALPVLEKLAASDEGKDKAGGYPVRRTAAQAIELIRLKTEEGPEHEEGAKPIPPAPLLSFHRVVGSARDNQPEGAVQVVLKHKVGQDEQFRIDPVPVLTEKSVVEAKAKGFPGDEPWEVRLQINEAGSMIFARYTLHHTNERLALLVEGQAISAPVIRSGIIGGDLVISGDFTEQEAKDLAKKINDEVGKPASDPH